MARAPFVLATALAALLATATVPSSAAAPEPDPIPTAWEFEFEPHTLRLVNIETPEDGVRPYFYLTFTITNHWGGDLLYAPEFHLKTDEGELLRSGAGVPAAVTAQVLQRLDNPLYMNEIEILGKIIEGVENARSGVVIWPANNLEIDEVTVFAMNLSGENTVYWTKAPEGDRRRNVLRKTLMLEFSTPGRLVPDNPLPLELAGETWVMR